MNSHQDNSEFQNDFYGIVWHERKKWLQLTFPEYHFCEMVYTLSRSQEWATAGIEYYANCLDLPRTTTISLRDGLVKRELLIKKEGRNNKLKVAQIWLDVVVNGKQKSIKNVHKKQLKKTNKVPNWNIRQSTKLVYQSTKLGLIKVPNWDLQSTKLEHIDKYKISIVYKYNNNLVNKLISSNEEKITNNFSQKEITNNMSKENKYEVKDELKEKKETVETLYDQGQGEKEVPLHTEEPPEEEKVTASEFSQLSEKNENSEDVKPKGQDIQSRMIAKFDEIHQLLYDKGNSTYIPFYWFPPKGVQAKPNLKALKSLKLIRERLKGKLAHLSPNVTDDEIIDNFEYVLRHVAQKIKDGDKFWAEQFIPSMIYSQIEKLFNSIKHKSTVQYEDSFESFAAYVESQGGFK